MATIKHSLALCALVVPLFASSVAAARPFRVSNIPNGDNFTCLACHGDTKASYNTDFGSDARFYLIPEGEIATQNVDWAPLCPIDSDKDGWTNGQELGDPNCTWKMADPDPKGFIYNPGVYESAPPPVCGSGKLEANEDCDGNQFAETNCALFGAGEGTLGCTAECKYDYSSCSAPPGTSPVPEPIGPADEGGCSMTSTSGAQDRDWGWMAIVGMGIVFSRRRGRGQVGCSKRSRRRILALRQLTVRPDRTTVGSAC